MIRALLPLALLAIVAPSSSANERSGDRALLPGPRPATVAELSLLNDALHRTAADLHRWAYTEHRVMRDAKGNVKSDTLLRFDPSKPYAGQWTPLRIDGREPTERERARYRRRGERSAEPRSPRLTPHPDNRRRRSLGELIEVMKSSVAAESATHLVFEIPLLKVGNERFPPEKFLVLARVSRQGRLENVSVSLRESFRSKFVVKVKSGEGSLEFTVVDPAHPPTLTSIEGSAAASVLFITISGTMALKRTELKRVKPYDERFEVQIGTLKAIDF